MTPAVRLTSALREKLGEPGLDPNLLISQFAEWKAGGEDDHYFFGKDGLGRGSKLLYHVHMVPLNVPQDQAKWDFEWENESRRSSDRYLFYADGGTRLGYLLIDVIDDPGAHEVWEPAHAEYRKAMEQTADDFVYFGKVP